MVKPWLTISVIAFGIIVAIAGVAAYIRMYRNGSMWTAEQPDRSKPSAPSVPASGEDKAGDEPADEGLK
ncbi:hypothetical protein [Paenibacillus humicola]|uniref:hypothetical protein n=1 Tax=Paenibacillus humicola TaxID=3110540 RepID=UPI00237C113E|nr:hypothetical protein [Paenibacillus humicola]